MRKYVLGMIGCGNMGTAMLRGILSANGIADKAICVYDHHPDRLRQQFGDAILYADNMQAAADANIVLLGVKPHSLLDVATCVKAHIQEQLIVSLAAGTTLAQLTEMFGDDAKLVRVMPNTPAAVNAAMSAVMAKDNVSQTELESILQLCTYFGKATLIPESLIDGFIAVAGSAPAYIYMMIEAMADGAVREGIPRQQAYTFAAQTVLGAAKMVLESGTHPAMLKDAVCSPGGTTIEAVTALEKNGMRRSVQEAMHICAEKSRAMSKGNTVK